MRNPSFYANFFIFHFWATFGLKLGVTFLIVWGLQIRPKKLAHWVRLDLLGPISKSFFDTFREDPLAPAP